MQNYFSYALKPAAVRRKRQRGMALAAGMLAMFGILSLILVGVLAGAHGGGGLLGLTENGDQSAGRQTQATAAFNTAESGIEYTLEWLHNQSGPPNLTKATLLSSLDSNSSGYTLNGGTFTVWIFPDVANSQIVANANGQDAPKKYLIQSTGLVNGISQTVQAYVSLTSFGKYAFFTDRDPANIYWVGGLNSFDGPTHFNGSDGVPTNVVWVDNTPIFNYSGNEAFTYSQSVNWYHNSQNSSQQAPQVINSNGTQTDQFLNVAKIGNPGVNRVPPISMPTSSLKQQYAALGQAMPDGTNSPPANAPTASSPSGITVTPGGGIYIHCANSINDTSSSAAASSASATTDVQQMVLSVDPNGNQVITIQQNNDAGTLTQTQITLDRVNGNTHIQAGPYNSSSQTFTMTALPDIPGVTNGVIYSDGNIGSTQQFGDSNGNPQTYGPDTAPGQGLSGVIADNQALTIATFADPGQSNASNKNINLNGSVTYNTPRAKDNTGAFLPETDPANTTFLQKAGTLGLVANTVQLVDNNAAGQPLGDTELDATALVQNTLRTVDYTTYYLDQNSSNNIGYTRSNGTTYYGHWLRQPHKFSCMGGEIASVRGALGTFNGSTLQVVTGFSGSYSYDTRLASNPPPFFPTTSSQYNILSWQRVAVPL